ncbi:MAG: single-stranded DNA-binding protein [Chlorobi bacterium]|nr:single-stranded DNA-binding protein [Chlorobiota bacterium]
MTNLTNSVRLIGRLGVDPKHVKLDSGTSKVSFTMATNEYYRDKNGEKVEETQWHNIVAFGKTAELAVKYLNKGSQVAVAGKLTNRQWDGKDGVKHYITEVNISQIHLLDKK